ncbi:uncharacterized protein [Haliotis asinina]|uniref:uncharacterized protein n=1 Tax=Haliotis asinina TaxID=109174 RepID=UPI00353257F4
MPDENMRTMAAHTVRINMAVTIEVVVLMCCVVQGLCVTHTDFKHQSNPADISHTLPNKQHAVNNVLEHNRMKIVPNSLTKPRAIYHLLRRRNRDSGTRRYQRSSGLDIYSHLAALSGGSVIGSNKTDVDHASSITVAEAALTSPVVVMVTHVNATASRDVTFRVDSALALILVEVTGHVSKSAIQLYDPTGVSVMNDKLVVDSAGALVYKIVKPTPGIWKVHLGDRQQSDVIVKGNSDVSFQCQFMKVNPVTGYDISVPGNPPAGPNLTVAIQVNGADKTRNITRVTLYTLNGDIIKSVVLTHVGRRGALYMAAINLPAQDVRLGISGTDHHGHRFTRVLQAAVSPESDFTVSFNMTAGESSTMSNDCARLPFVVANHGASGSFSARVTSLNTALNPVVKPNVFTIPKGHTYTGTVAVTANMTTPSTAGDVVLTVTGPSGVSDFVRTPVVIYSGPTANIISASKTSPGLNKDTMSPTTAAIPIVSKDVTKSIIGSREATTVTSASTEDTSTTLSVVTELPGYTSFSASTGRPDSTFGEPPGSTASTSGGLYGSTVSTTGVSPGSTAPTSGGFPGSTASTSGVRPGSTASTSGVLPGSTASTSSGPPGSKTSTSGELPGSTISTGGLTGLLASTSGGPPGTTASRPGGNHAMKPAIIASIVCGCVAGVTGVGLCVLFLTRRGFPRTDRDKDHHYMDAGQYNNASIDKGRYNAGYEMDLYEPHKG